MEWQVVTVIIALVGLIALVTGPIIRLNSTITKLSVILRTAEARMDRLEKVDAEIQEHSADAHQRIHTRIDDQVEVLHEHDKRIHTLENERTKGRMTNEH